jgi:hypothetical protein
MVSLVQSVGRRFLSSDWLLCFLLFFPLNIFQFIYRTKVDQCHAHNHDIVFSDNQILFRSLRLGMANNVAEDIFHFLFMKYSFFIFERRKVSFL